MPYKRYFARKKDSRVAVCLRSRQELLYNALTHRHCAANEWARSLARFDSILFCFRTENMHTADNREARRSNRLGPIIFDCARRQFISQTFTYGDDALIVGFYYDLIKRGAFS